MSFFLKTAKPAEGFDPTIGPVTYPAPEKDDGYPYLYGERNSDSWQDMNARYGTVGGNDPTDVQAEMQVYVKIGANPAVSTGYIIRQKGRSKFLVTDGTNTGVCTLVNVSAPFTLTEPDTMALVCTTSTAATFTVARIKNKRVIDFNGVAYLTTPDQGYTTPTPPAGSNASGGVVTPNLR